MKIKILGAHNLETRESRCVCLLIDDVLALDAGALTSSLSFTAQQKLRAVVLSHLHYDHLRDIPALAINYSTLGKTIDVYATRSVYDALSHHLLNGILYPKFLEEPPEKPVVHFNLVEPNKPVKIAGYDVLALPVSHIVSNVGFMVKPSGGKTLFYTSDTGPGLAACWRAVSPDLLIIEVTMLNKDHELALHVGHLTPALLQEELVGFRKLKGYLPKVLLVHVNPLYEKMIKAEIGAVENALGIPIQIAREGMQIEL